MPRALNSSLRPQRNGLCFAMRPVLFVTASWSKCMRRSKLSVFTRKRLILLTVVFPPSFRQLKCDGTSSEKTDFEIVVVHWSAELPSMLHRNSR